MDLVYSYKGHGGIATGIVGGITVVYRKNIGDDIAGTPLEKEQPHRCSPPND